MGALKQRLSRFVLSHNFEMFQLNITFNLLAILTSVHVFGKSHFTWAIQNHYTLIYVVDMEGEFKIIHIRRNSNVKML